MAYSKNIWAIYDPSISDDLQEDAFLSKKKLENIENGIEAAHKLAESATATIEIGTVSGGDEASAEVVDGKLNLTLPKGEKGEAGDPGEKGEPGENGTTPVKGTDYFTEEDKNELIDNILAKQKREPYYDETLNKLFACGVHINVYAAKEAGKLRVTWSATSDSDGKELIIPENADIYGGGASDGNTLYYPSSSIAVHGGNIDSVIGGCFGNGFVGSTTIVINGGKLTYVCGGGMHWADKKADMNGVGTANIVLNNCENVEYVHGGTCSGTCSTGTNKITVNGGKYGVVMVGGTNGYTGDGEIIVNDGTIRTVQGGNRGMVGNIKITINGGTLTNGVFGGCGDTGIYIKSELILNGGTIPKAEAGKYAGQADTTASRISGTYVDGVISDDMAAKLHLVKVETINSLLQKINELEALISN